MSSPGTAAMASRLRIAVGGFDLGDGQHGVVGMLGVIGPGIDRGPPRAIGAGALGRIAGSAAMKRPASSGGVHHRADHAIGAGVQRPHDVAGIVPLYTHHRHRVGGGDGGEDGNHGGMVGLAVLLIDGEAIPALMGDLLGGNGGRQHEPEIGGGLAGGPDLFPACWDAWERN